MGRTSGHYEKRGVNLLKANTRDKKTLEKWSEWQDNPIPEELHE